MSNLRSGESFFSKYSKELSGSFFNSSKKNGLEEFCFGVYEDGMLIDSFKTNYLGCVQILEKNAVSYAAYLQRINYSKKYEVKRLS